MWMRTEEKQTNPSSSLRHGDNNNSRTNENQKKQRMIQNLNSVVRLSFFLASLCDDKHNRVWNNLITAEQTKTKRNREQTKTKRNRE